MGTLYIVESIAVDGVDSVRIMRAWLKRRQVSNFRVRFYDIGAAILLELFLVNLLVRCPWKFISVLWEWNFNWMRSISIWTCSASRHDSIDTLLNNVDVISCALLLSHTLSYFIIHLSWVTQKKALICIHNSLISYFMASFMLIAAEQLVQQKTP